VIGYSTDADGRPKLSYEVTVLDPGGLLMAAPWRDEYTGRQGTGNPVHNTFRLTVPRSVPAGTCKFVIKVRDALNNAALELTAPFQVDAPPIAPAASLELRDFQLSLTSDGPGVAVPELQDGGTVYMRCNLFGIQFRGDDADVQLALKVFGPGGSVLLDKPDYLVIRDSFVYHPATFYVPVTGHVSLPSGADKGAYRAVYTATDRIANRTLVQEGRFEVK
jgi:hypothetical protein